MLSTDVLFLYVITLRNGKHKKTATATCFCPKGSDDCPSRAETCGDFRNTFFIYHKFVLVFLGVFRSVEQPDSSPNIMRVIKSRRMRWAGHVARMGEERGVYRVWMGKPERKRPLGRPKRRWVDNIRMDLQEVECGYMDCIGLAQDRDRWRTLVSAVMNLRVP